VVPMLLDLRVVSIEEALTFDKHYSDLLKVCETHRVEILVNSVESYGRTVVSTRREYRFNCHVGRFLTTAVSIPIT